MHHNKPETEEDPYSITNGFWYAHIGWVVENKKQSFVAGTYLHGIFENGRWRRLWLNQVRQKKGLFNLSIEEKNHAEKRELLIDLLADKFEEHIDISPLLE